MIQDYQNILQENNYICTLCDDNMIDNDRVICPFCNIEICESCFQYGLTMELQNPMCIYCKKILSLEFILSNNNTQWCSSIFISYFENLCLEKEKILLPDSIEKYKIQLEIKDFKKNLNDIPTNKKIENNLKYVKKNNLDIYNIELKNQIELRNHNKLEIKIKINNLECNKIRLKKEKNLYISKCSFKDCKGYINNKYFCELCNNSICNACMKIKIQNKEHLCNVNDISSAKFIRDSSKSCPKCYVPIFTPLHI